MQTLGEIKSVATPGGTVARCAFTIDVEDWYQSSVDFDAPISHRVLDNVKRVVEVLDECEVKATFFVQGLVAKKFPGLLQKLLSEGHEIQSHGHTHRPLFSMDWKSLRIELENARKSIKDACGVEVTAFRAPDFSILKPNIWALELLLDCGFTVDSSIFPMQMKRYGIVGQNTCPYQVDLPCGGQILEAPVAVWEVGRMRIPVAGGGYFRLLPQWFLKQAFREMLAAGQPIIIYCHPYEFNPRELKSYRGKVSKRFLFSQGLGRASFIERVRYLLETFPFGRFDEVIENWKQSTGVDSRELVLR